MTRTICPECDRTQEEPYADRCDRCQDNYERNGSIAADAIAELIGQREQLPDDRLLDEITKVLEECGILLPEVLDTTDGE